MNLNSTELNNKLAKINITYGEVNVHICFYMLNAFVKVRKVC